ncbi:MAG: hypothetical protein K2M34_03515 [Alphaproteobacteria bacterium]|nr:hypothetical protein [Alphaproteobacteria bacterium]
MKLSLLLSNIKNNNIISEYSHSNYIDMVSGVPCLHMDCSGFVFWYLLNNGYKRALAELKFFLKENNFIKITRFYCKDFAEMHQQQDKFHYWQFMNKPAKESILVIVFPDGNGHCMIVNEIIQQSATSYELNIIDSTRYPHRNDSRTIDQTGIGIGNVSIQLKNGEWYYDAGNDMLGIRQAMVYFIKPVK